MQILEDIRNVPKKYNRNKTKIKYKKNITALLKLCLYLKWIPVWFKICWRSICCQIISCETNDWRSTYLLCGVLAWSHTSILQFGTRLQRSSGVSIITFLWKPLQSDSRQALHVFVSDANFKHVQTLRDESSDTDQAHVHHE